MFPALRAPNPEPAMVSNGRQRNSQHIEPNPAGVKKVGGAGEPTVCFMSLISVSAWQPQSNPHQPHCWVEVSFPVPINAVSRDAGRPRCERGLSIRVRSPRVPGRRLGFGRQIAAVAPHSRHRGRPRPIEPHTHVMKPTQPSLQPPAFSSRHRVRLRRALPHRLSVACLSAWTSLTTFTSAEVVQLPVAADAFITSGDPGNNARGEDAIHAGTDGPNGGNATRRARVGRRSDLDSGGYRTVDGLSGTVSLVTSNLLSLIDGSTYVNLHTTNYPGGEIRGHILR